MTTNDRDKLWLEYGMVLKGISVFLACLVVIFAKLWFEATDAEDREINAWLAITIFIFDVPLIIEFFFVRIGYDSHNIYCKSGWRSNRIVPWKDVKSCIYSPLNKWWVVETETQGLIRAHEFLSGRDQFIEVMDKKGFIPKEKDSPKDDSSK